MEMDFLFIVVELNFSVLYSSVFDRVEGFLTLTELFWNEYNVDVWLSPFPAITIVSACCVCVILQSSCIEWRVFWFHSIYICLVYLFVWVFEYGWTEFVYYCVCISRNFSMFLAFLLDSYTEKNPFQFWKCSVEHHGLLPKN